MLQVSALGRTAALFREPDGTLRCVDGWCPHRGAPLGKGWTKQTTDGRTCVVCPYHGWAFDGQGACCCGVFRVYYTFTCTQIVSETPFT